MRKYKTQRTTIAIITMAIIVLSAVFWFGLKLIKLGLESLGVDYLEKLNEDFILVLPLSLIVITMVVWAIRNKLYYGLGYAIAHAGIERRLRRQLADAYIVTSREFDGEIKHLPKIKIIFDNHKTRDSGKVLIEKTMQFQTKLENANIDSALSSRRRSYIVESQYPDEDKRFYSYDFISTRVVFKQQKFINLADYIKWTKETADDYQIRIDNRTTIEITHMGISGITGSGKSYFLQALVEQILSKNVKHQLYIVDPKRSDLFQQARRNLPESQYCEYQDILPMLMEIRSLMENRKKQLDDFLRDNPNRTYKDAELPAIILLIDEMGSLREEWKLLPKGEREEIDRIIGDVTFQGRQLGVFLWIASQQVSANTLPTSVRDQLIYKCVLGPSEDTTYRVMFSQSVNIQNIKLGPGQGYFSYPMISTTQNPKLVSIPFCAFLKEQYWASGRAKPARKP